MKQVSIFIFQILLAFSCYQSCLGSYITLDVNPYTSFKKGIVCVTAEITNHGDENAMNVSFESSITGLTPVSSDKTTNLSVNATVYKSVKIDTKPLIPGVYTAILKVHYSDANGYPFTSLTYIPVVTTIITNNDNLFDSSLFYSSLIKQGSISTCLKSSATNTISCNIRLETPDELECISNDCTTNIQEGSACTTTYEIKNLSALPGSTYSVLAVVAYTLDGIHREQVIPGQIHIRESDSVRSVSFFISLIAVIILLIVFIVIQRSSLRARIYNIMGINADVADKDALCSGKMSLYFDISILVFITGFLFYNMAPHWLFANTTLTGGDTPAHNYLASHLQAQILHNSRIASWSNGWWCGFPMFQYYFYLPYLMVSVLNIFLPFNIALKLVSVSGMLVLPSVVYASARILRAQKPIPIFAAIGMIPFLFVRSHTMWGANAYSTLAGMLANSISFPVMLLFIASAFRDSEDGKFRLRTVFLLAALISSHFFTSVMACLTVAVMPLLKPRSGFKKSFSTLACEGILAGTLMMWWLIPLIAKAEFSVDFGTNWDVVLFQVTDVFPYFTILVLPAYAVCLLPFAIIAAFIGFKQKSRFIALTLTMLIVASLLFFFGYNNISKVFVNVRLWPFIFYCILILETSGIAFLVSNKKWKFSMALAILIAALAFGLDKPNEVKAWANWNYSGMEQKANWSVFKDLVLPLKRSKGRLANDLNELNNSMGSSRIFESVPHLIGKPILEGGIVNSAIGSIFSYYIQGETSDSCAGYPLIVKPAEFNFDNASAHLELFNVKHFIARSPRTKEALHNSPKWDFIRKSGEWELFEMNTHNGSYIAIPQNLPMAVRPTPLKRGLGWKNAVLNWMYSINSINQYFAILGKNDKPNKTMGPVLNEDSFNKYLTSISTTNKNVLTYPSSTISDEEITDTKIKFKTTGIGLPHIIKFTYFPNWKVKGAKKIYMVTPCFMLVYPTQEDVELYYGRTLSDNIGILISVLGLLLCISILARRRVCKHNREIVS